MFFNISEAANLAIHALTYLAGNPDLQPIPTGQVAGALGASDNHLSKVFQRLAKVGLVKSIRGPHGGFNLTKAPDQITLLAIYEAIDGKLVNTSCLLEHPACDRDTCVFGNLVTDIQDKAYDHFSSTTLAELVKK